VRNIVDKIYNLLDNKRNKYITIASAFAVIAVLPLFMNNYVLTVSHNAMHYILLALGLNIIVGYCGMCDLGYAAKFAIGAYTTGILIRTLGWSFWLTLPASVIVSVIIALIIGAPTLKLRSDYLAIVTLGFAEIVRITAQNLEITGRASGIHGITRPHFFGIHLTGATNWYYTLLVLIVIYVFISYRIRHSRFGRALAYIKEDEDAAQAMGVNTTSYKLCAYAIGAVLGGVAGSFFAVRMTSISPGSFDFTQSANIMLAVILGGMGKIPGVMIGAVFFAVFPELFRFLPTIGGIRISDMRMLFFGLLLIIVMIKRPQGLWPERRTKK